MFNKMVKMRNKKGFTLMELLIVVAIIAILVAISIPIFTSQLEKAREQTDIANMRAAKAVAVATYLVGDTSTGNKVDAGVAFDAYYDAANGVLLSAKADIATYGKGTSANGGCEAYMGYTNDTAAAGKILKVSVAADGKITESWE